LLKRFYFILRFYILIHTLRKVKSLGISSRISPTSLSLKDNGDVWKVKALPASKDPKPDPCSSMNLACLTSFTFLLLLVSSASSSLDSPEVGCGDISKDVGKITVCKHGTDDTVWREFSLSFNTLSYSFAFTLHCQRIWFMQFPPNYLRPLPNISFYKHTVRKNIFNSMKYMNASGNFGNNF